MWQSHSHPILWDYPEVDSSYFQVLRKTPRLAVCFRFSVYPMPRTFYWRRSYKKCDHLRSMWELHFRKLNRGQYGVRGFNTHNKYGFDKNGWYPPLVKQIDMIMKNWQSFWTCAAPAMMPMHSESLERYAASRALRPQMIICRVSRNQSVVLCGHSYKKPLGFYMRSSQRPVGRSLWYS
jgi:hypothetical protein